MKSKFKTNPVKKKNEIRIFNSGYHDLKPIFSFADYIKTDKYFSMEHCSEKRNSLYNFLECIKKFSEKTWGEMKMNPCVYHFHPFNEDLSILNKYKDDDLAQFKIPGQQQGRYIGFFDNSNIFHILLYDSEHKANPRK